MPWHVICDAARDEGAALVVIGSHGYRGIDRLLGTTASKVVDYAKQSVLLRWASCRADRQRRLTSSTVVAARSGES
jgi:hypothetical protein